MSPAPEALRRAEEIVAAWISRHAGTDGIADMLAARRALIEAIAAALPQWRPIETVPDPGSWLITGPGYGTCVGMWDGKRLTGPTPLYHWAKVTHWMPLPEPPQ